MIIEVIAENCFVFSNEVNFSLKANMKNKKFSSNVYKENNFNILKVAGLYGPNNSGKTCLVKCIGNIKNVLLHKPNNIMSNIFSDSPICKLGITFLQDGRKFNYTFKYDVSKDEYPYEKFSEILKDKYKNEKEKVYLIRDVLNKEYRCINNEIEKMLPVISKDNILIYLIDADSFKELNDMKKILTLFAEKIDIVNMNDIPMDHTIKLMKNKNSLQKKVVDFIKNADLYLEDFRYVNLEDIKISEKHNKQIDEKVLNIPENIIDRFRLVSVYKGKPVPSLLFDSTGTKKIAALASYVIEAIENGRILIIDELDSSLHFKLTRAIVAMFNNELNTKAQMIFTVHDINLMDCQRLFRKEQIWFVYKDNEGVYVYSLADFTAEQGIRDTTDIIEKYKKGALGALPKPELINSLLNIVNDSKEKYDD